MTRDPQVPLRLGADNAGDHSASRWEGASSAGVALSPRTPITSVRGLREALRNRSTIAFRLRASLAVNSAAAKCEFACTSSTPASGTELDAQERCIAPGTKPLPFAFRPQTRPARASHRSPSTKKDEARIGDPLVAFRLLICCQVTG